MNFKDLTLIFVIGGEGKLLFLTLFLGGQITSHIWQQLQLTLVMMITYSISSSI